MNKPLFVFGFGDVGSFGRHLYISEQSFWVRHNGLQDDYGPDSTYDLLESFFGNLNTGQLSESIYEIPNHMSEAQFKNVLLKSGYFVYDQQFERAVTQ